MIDERNARFPRPQIPKREPTEAERKQAAETLAYLEALPWQPFDVEW